MAGEEMEGREGGREGGREEGRKEGREGGVREIFNNNKI